MANTNVRTRGRDAVCKDARAFLKHHLGTAALAALTGQDERALSAFIHLLDLYCVSDERGRAAALAAMKSVLDCAQPSVLEVFKKCIPHALDWSDEERIWQEVRREREPSDVRGVR